MKEREGCAYCQQCTCATEARAEGIAFALKEAGRVCHAASGDIAYSDFSDAMEAEYERLTGKPIWCTCNDTNTCEGHRA